MNLEELNEKVERNADRVDAAESRSLRQIIAAGAAALSILGAGLAAWVTMSERVAVLEAELNHVEDEIHDIEEEVKEDGKPKKKRSWWNR